MHSILSSKDNSEQGNPLTERKIVAMIFTGLWYARKFLSLYITSIVGADTVSCRRTGGTGRCDKRAVFSAFVVHRKGLCFRGMYGCVGREFLFLFSFFFFFFLCFFLVRLMV